MEDRIYKVSEFNKLIKSFIESKKDFHDFFLKGELSGITYYRSGHLYFTLKDKNAQIKCVAFNYKLKKIPNDLKEGETVTIFGDVGFYETRGNLQILVRHIEKNNQLGYLFEKLENVKKSFKEKGYFSKEHKKAIPKFPKNIGIVTSPVGAAFHDIITTAKRRMNGINFYFYPAKVQGESSVEEIIKGIKILDSIPEIDLIIAGRGGGSIEDLWSFNEEKTALAFFHCKKPIISAVGHETDFLLTDLVADIRAATPTQSAEIAVPSKFEILEILNNKKHKLNNLVENKIVNCKNDLYSHENSHSIKNFISILNNYREKLVSLEVNTNRAISLYLKYKNQSLDLKTEKLIHLNPLTTLKRGYSITFYNNSILKSISKLKTGENILTKLNDGEIISTIKEIKN